MVIFVIEPVCTEQALQSLSEYTLTRINRDESRGLRKMVERLQEENAVLMGKVESHANEVLTSAESELKDALKKARQDMVRSLLLLPLWLMKNLMK